MALGPVTKTFPVASRYRYIPNTYTSTPLHLSLTPSTFAHPFHRLLPPFPILLLHAHSLPSANRTQSVIPAHSFFWLVAAWVKSRAERPSVSGVNRQLHVQIGCKLGIRNRKDELTKQAKRNKLQIKPEGN